MTPETRGGIGLCYQNGAAADRSSLRVVCVHASRDEEDRSNRGLSVRVVISELHRYSMADGPEVYR